jgi:hypothetical protein
LLVSDLSPSLAYGIGQGSVVNSLAFFPTLTLRVECGAAAAKAQPLATFRRIRFNATSMIRIMDRGG